LIFVKKWYVIGFCKYHFVFQHTKILEEEPNFPKKIFSRRPVLFLHSSEIGSLVVHLCHNLHRLETGSDFEPTVSVGSLNPVNFVAVKAHITHNSGCGLHRLLFSSSLTSLPSFLISVSPYFNFMSIALSH
jgi:hypothetical protein